MCFVLYDFSCVQVLLLKIPRGWDLLLCWKTSDTSLDTLISSWLAAQESSWFATSPSFSFSKLAFNCIERINRNGVSRCFISNRLKSDCSKLRKYGNISSLAYNNAKFYPYSWGCANSSTQMNVAVQLHHNISPHCLLCSARASAWSISIHWCTLHLHLILLLLHLHLILLPQHLHHQQPFPHC